MEPRPINVVVVGGGTGGTLAANLLTKQLHNEIDTRRVQVHLVAGSDRRHIFQPGYLHIAFGDLEPKKIIHEESTLVRREVQLIEQDATRIDPTAKEITLVSGEKLPYDYLIVATGSIADPGIIPGLRRQD